MRNIYVDLTREFNEGRLRAVLSSGQAVKRNVRRLKAYLDAGSRWAARWRELSRELADLPLPEAHRRMVENARGLLPTRVAWDSDEEPESRSPS